MSFFRKKKSVTVVDRYNWLDIDYGALAKQFKPHGFIRKLSSDYPVDVQVTRDDLESYGPFVLYHVCVDLDLYPAEVDMAVPEHSRVCEKYVAMAKGFERHLLESIENIPPETILYCQGYQLESFIVRKICAERKIGLLAIENTFDSRKFVWDNLSGITVNRNLAENYYWKYENFVDTTTARKYADEYRAGLKSFKSGEHSSGCEPFLCGPDEKIMLFLGQVYTDSSVLFGINDFTNQVKIIEQLFDYCLQHGIKLFVKLHPKEVAGKNIHNEPYDKVTYRKIKENRQLAEAIEREAMIVDYDHYDTYDLISKAAGCVTINSQAGLEALLMGKDVVLCGKSFYSGFNLTFNAQDASDLAYCLDRVFMKGTSRNKPEVSEKLFYIITNYYFQTKTPESFLDLLR